MQQQEIWKPITDYEGLYEVSNLGRVRSVARTITQLNRWGGSHTAKINGKLLKQVCQRHGYLIVSLSKSGSARQYLVHRLVATAFIERPTDANTVNHLNECKTDNRASNLEWLSLQDNIHYGTGVYRGHANRDRQWHREHRGGLNPAAKAVKQLSLDGEVINTFDCIIDAAKASGVCYSSICAAAKGKTKTAGGFKWAYIITNF